MFGFFWLCDGKRLVKKQYNKNRNNNNNNEWTCIWIKLFSWNENRQRHTQKKSMEICRCHSFATLLPMRQTQQSMQTGKGPNCVRGEQHGQKKEKARTYIVNIDSVLVLIIKYTFFLTLLFLSSIATRQLECRHNQSFVIQRQTYWSNLSKIILFILFPYLSSCCEIDLNYHFR